MRKKKEKTYLFVDGTNLYAAQYELFGPENYLNFSEFIDHVQKALSVKFDKIYFYASYSPKPNRPTEKQKRYLKNEGLFYRSVRNTKRVIFYAGHRSPTSGKEKGIDIHLGIDMVKSAFLKKCTQMILITGDADLLYAVEVSQAFGVPVHSLFLPNRLSIKIAINTVSATVINYGNRLNAIYIRKIRKLKIVTV